MKKIFLSFFIILFLTVLPAQAKTVAPWKPITPEGYTPIGWVKASGVESFMKIPPGNGYVDYLTIINLANSEVRLISSSTPPVVWGPAQTPFNSENSADTATSTLADWAVPRMVVEQTKTANPDTQFFWNVPFFNVTVTTTDLSLALKSTFATDSYITSGSRPTDDTAQARRMLIIDNTTGSGTISDFDAATFVKSGDQAVEGFSPTVTAKGTNEATARLFLGIRPGGKELVVYCSQGASPEEASAALLAAGVPLESQLQADGGTSATCTYNLPGQYFVEPGRTLPYLMGATPLAYRGVITTDKLNVRTGPGIKNKAIDRLAKNTPVKVFERKKGWARISTSQEWVSEDYIRKIKV